VEIEEIGNRLIKALENANYRDSTVFNYRGVFRRFKAFCGEKGVTEYSLEIGAEYANAVISPMTGKYSPQRYSSQMRFIRFFDSFIDTGSFEFNTMKRGQITPSNLSLRTEYEKFHTFLKSKYENENTIDYYKYGMYCFLQFLDDSNINDFKSLKMDLIITYFIQVKESRKRSVLCELRCILKYLGRDDLIEAIAGIHAPRRKKIIPMLTDGEMERLQATIEGVSFSKRDKAIILLGLTSGIRAIDVINLKLADVSWINETITFRQTKTGNLVCLPLLLPVGNAIVEYIMEERPNVGSEYLFLSEKSPYQPLTGHASCYSIVKSCFKKAGIEKSGRIFGMHMLRHNAASTMIRNEVPIETIEAILGHSSPESTDIYITTDEKRLKSCVLPLTSLSEGGTA
jgi:integrase